MNITASQVEIIKALAKYKYLTVSQLDKLKIFKNKVSIYRALTPLKAGKYPLVLSQGFGLIPGHGRLEQILFLSKHAKDLLVDELQMDEKYLKIPTSKTLISTDYFHRIWTIEFNLQLNLYSKKNNASVIFFDYYYDKARKAPNAKFAKTKNRIDIASNGKFIIPDGVTKFHIQGRDYLYLFEQHNGYSITKIITQIYNHCLVIKEAGAKEKYNFDRNNRVVIVFEHDKVMDSVIHKCKDDESLKKFSDFFLLKSNKILETDFFRDWKNLYGINSLYI